MDIVACIQDMGGDIFMSRTRRTRKKQLPYWLTGKSYRWDGNKMMPPWIRLDQTLLQDETFRSLSPSTQMTYLCMCIEAGKDNDHFTFTSETAKQYQIPLSTFRRSIEELKASGFLKAWSAKQRDHGYHFGERDRPFTSYLPTQYQLSGDWKNK